MYHGNRNKYLFSDVCENQVHGEVEFRFRCCRSWKWILFSLRAACVLREAALKAGSVLSVPNQWKAHMSVNQKCKANNSVGASSNIHWYVRYNFDVWSIQLHQVILVSRYLWPGLNPGQLANSYLRVDHVPCVNGWMADWLVFHVGMG